MLRRNPLRGRLHIAGIVGGRVEVDHVGIVRITARGVERRRIEEQIVKFSRRRRPLLADHLCDVENLWRDQEKTEPRRQEPSVVVRHRCDTMDKVVGSCAAPLGVLGRRLGDLHPAQCRHQPSCSGVELGALDLPPYRAFENGHDARSAVS